jgi:hypothetical protein
MNDTMLSRLWEVTVLIATMHCNSCTFILTSRGLTSKVSLAYTKHFT